MLNTTQTHSENESEVASDREIESEKEWKIEMAYEP